MLTFTFEVVPTGWDGGKIDGLPFEPFLMDVPGLTAADEDRAARRAYWSAMSRLRHLEPEQFQVFEWAGTAAPVRGREVGPGGFTTEGGV